MRLSDLVKQLTGARVLSLPRDLPVQGVTYDSRQVRDGFIFVAIPGALTDGHLYIDQALEKGALAVVLERPRCLSDVAEIEVPFARRALAELSRAFYGFSDRGLFMIGVTATNGKTTTTSMVQHILNQKGIMTSLIGSVAYHYGDQRAPSSLTTPESADLHAMLREQADAGVQVVAMEVSSIALAQCRVYGIDYDAVAFLNITPDHMPDHGSFEAYYEAKASLVREVAPGTPVILNCDQEEVYALKDQTRGRVIGIGIGSAEADVSAESLELPAGMPHFQLVIRRPLETGRGVIEAGSWPVTLPLPGRHTAYNAMAAILLAGACGIAPGDSIRALESFRGVERRLQIIYQGEFTLIDDHISDEDNTRKMLEALAVMTDHKPIHLIYAIRGNRGIQVNREVIGQFRDYASRLNWKTFTVTSSTDTARRRDIVSEEEYAVVCQDLSEAGYDFVYEPELASAIQTILPRVKPGEFMVLAGSHNMDKGARIALNLLAEMRPAEERESILAPLENRLMG